MSANPPIDEAEAGARASAARSAFHLPLAWWCAVGLIAVSAFVYSRSWSELLPYWTGDGPTYADGSLVVLVSGWLAWRARVELADVPVSPSAVALPVVLALSFAWLVAAGANMSLPHALLWPLLTLSLVWAGAGMHAARAMAFPLGFLYLSLPLSDFLVPPLQNISAWAVEAMTSVAGVPAVVEGHFVLLPYETVEIASGCSGANFFGVAVAIGALAGELRGDRWLLRVGLVVLAALLSMVFNWLRIFLIVLAYLAPETKNFVESLGHHTLGWWVFAADLVVFFLILRFIPLSEPPAQRPSPDRTQPKPAAWPGLLTAIVAATVLPFTSWALARGDESPVRLATAPRLAVASGPLAPDPQWLPRYLGVAWEYRVAYLTGDGSVVELYRNEYQEQSQGAELIGRGTEIFDSRAFPVSSTSTISMRGPDGRDLELNMVEMATASGRDWVGLYTYLVDDVPTRSAGLAQIVTGLRAILDRPTAGVLAVAMPCNGDCSAARESLELVFRAAYDSHNRERSAT